MAKDLAICLNVNLELPSVVLQHRDVICREPCAVARGRAAELLVNYVLLG